MHCAEYVVKMQKHFQNNHRPLSSMFIEKNQIEVTLPWFSSLNQVAQTQQICAKSESRDVRHAEKIYRSL